MVLLMHIITVILFIRVNDKALMQKIDKVLLELCMSKKIALIQMINYVKVGEIQVYFY